MLWYQKLAVVLFVLVLIIDLAIAVHKDENFISIAIRAFMVIAFPFIINWF